MTDTLHIPGYELAELRGAGYELIIDVSGHQGADIDWGEVAASGVVGVIVKISEGADSTYRTAKAHVEGARSVGLYVSIYHFATLYYDRGAEDWDAICEAHATLDAIASLGFDSWVIPPCLDVEKWNRIDATLTPGATTTWLHAYLGYVHIRLGVAPLVYVSAKAFSRTGSGRVLDRNGLEAYGLWVADYSRSKGPIGSPRLPGDWQTEVIHQFSSDGRVPGIEGDVDLNVVRRTTLHRWAVAASMRPMLALLEAG